jgi:potassium-dependent mechanosensitive channel
MVQRESFAALLARIWDYPLLTLGGGALTIALVVKTIAGLLIVWLVAIFMQRRLVLRLLRRTVLESGTQFAVSRIVYYVTFVLGVFLVLDAVGMNLSSLAFVGGIIGIGIGFGFQNIASNFISGIILLVERPVSVGDVVTVGDSMGTIQAINIRVTRVLTTDNVILYVPNSRLIDNTVMNWTAMNHHLRAKIEIMVGRDADPNLIRRALLEIAASDSRVLREPPPIVRFAGFTQAALNLQLLVWLPNIDLYADVPSDLRFAIVERFRELGIDAPKTATA